MSKDREKQLAAEASLELVEDGMTLGLGTGSTAKFAILKLGEMVRKGLKVRAVPTSEWTHDLAQGQGIPLVDFSQVTRLDLTLDGADELDADLHLIKGGGGALFREKIVARASDRMVVFADAAKQVEHLGAFPLPVEVNPFGWQVAAEKIKALGATVKLREVNGNPFVSDNHGYILDCSFGVIKNPPALEDKISAITGVMETGLFIHICKMAYLGGKDGVVKLKPR
ncbi:MAG: ribose-5-phosphate isomerase RpiA [Deltaproteobacteria bacterium]|nr:ribose-5-phosphate isomerase RpiA [Deltaproteobacteria bacterium]